MNFEVAIVGAGPGGLAAAIEVALRGKRAVVLERRSGALDKACGEGLMPGGLRALERLGVRQLIEASQCASFRNIRYVQEDGSHVDGRLPEPGGLGIRRLALSAALKERALALGVELREGCGLKAHRREASGVTLITDAGEVQAQLLVAADGLHSPLRRAEGLELPPLGPQRFGMRRHFQIETSGPHVEVHLSDGVEAYLTPAGTAQVGLAFLWEHAHKTNFETLLARFPRLAERFAQARPLSEIQGAGPMLQRVSARVKDRFVLLGDASGYVDAITGEGLSQAFGAAAALGAVIGTAAQKRYSADSLQPYARAVDRAFEKYATTAQRVLWLVRHPVLRRTAMKRLQRWPGLLTRILKAAI